VHCALILSLSCCGTLSTFCKPHVTRQLKCETLHSPIIDFARSDAHGTFNGGDEDLAVADLASLSGTLDGLERLVGLGVRNRNFDHGFGQELHGVIGAAVEFRMALLPAATLDVETVIPSMPRSVSAARTSSSLNGLMIAVISFTRAPPLSHLQRGRGRPPLLFQSMADRWLFGRCRWRDHAIGEMDADASSHVGRNAGYP